MFEANMGVKSAARKADVGHVETASARKPRAGRIAASSASFGAQQDSLNKYLDDMGTYDVFDAAREVEMAQQIEDLEIRHYKALLDHGPALDAIIAAVKPHMRAPKELEELRKLAKSTATSAAAKTRRTLAVDAAARSLRERDVSRVVLADVDESVRKALEGQAGTARYLERVRRARLAQQTAKNEFMTANLRLVVSLARRHDRGLMPLSDLIQEGNLGLMRAVERFDHRKGFRFSTYASWWIRHGLSRALSDKARLVRLPVHLLDQVQRTARASADLERKTGRVPSTAELASSIGVSEDKVTFVQTHAQAQRPTSLDRPLGSDGEGTLLDVMANPADAEPEEALDMARWPASLGRLLTTLSPIEASILRFRFGLEDSDELTLAEIGEKYNLSRERIRQLQEQALLKLRSQLARERSANDAA